MKKLQYSDEQLAIKAAGQDSTDNLLITALAGAAKSTTLELLANSVPQRTVIALAFNKKIADEMREKLPRRIEVRTMNALGHRLWGQALGKKLFLDTGKIYRLVTEFIDNQVQQDRDALQDNLSFLLQSVRLLKSNGWVPSACLDDDDKCGGFRVTPVVLDDEAPDYLEEEPTKAEWACIHYASRKSFLEAIEGKIDFGDQLLLPGVCKIMFPPTNLVLIDEAQDLSSLDHELLRKLVGSRGRLIAVGDENQAIYGFRGADADSMNRLETIFSMRRMELSCSFRCPEAIVRSVHWKTPHMKWWEGNPSNGHVDVLDSWDYSDIPEDSAIICRNNAPLLTHTIGLIKAGRRANFWGKDILEMIIKEMGKLGDSHLSRNEALAACENARNRRLQKTRNKKQVEDQFDCIRLFIERTDNLGAAKAEALRISQSRSGVDLMTGHKAKGHEFRNVYFLDSNIIADEGQDPNIRYVIQTRSFENLVYIDSDNRVGK